MNYKLVFSILIVMAVLFLSCEKRSKKEFVTIFGRQLLVNETPYLIKGICYHLVPSGTDKRSFNNLTEDLAIMV